MLTEAGFGIPEHWAIHAPETLAIVKDEKSITYITYKDWNDRANPLAKRGLRSGDRLGLRFSLNLNCFIVQRALQKLGVVQVAVSWKFTPTEAEYILRDSGARSCL